MKILIAVLLLGANIANAQNNNKQIVTSAKGFAVVELFTSQGCRSCPAADKVLAEIKAEAEKISKPVHVLSYHVDYWNKYGWMDPFSKFAFTKRQNNYVSANKTEEVYTPQVYVNGQNPTLGSDKIKINEAIEKAITQPPVLNLTAVKSALSTSDTLIIDYTSTKVNPNYSLVIAIVQEEATSKITKGENAGKTLSYNNIVRELNITPLNNQKGIVKIPVKNLSLKNGFRVLAFVQQKQTKKILSVTQLAL
ncbi:MAG: DUF1223 domain-containing protein [Bacteroidetes bacterium]|nr:DUF1223 domain-containing protein [Bacteroidota bacterium]HNR19119.1 DUF1223 domain-containing protein [Bacteroidia bacterium]HNU33675.1 DUF1223 domain-containing protein [Bacteroidia bacterium]